MRAARPRNTRSDQPPLGQASGQPSIIRGDAGDPQSDELATPGARRHQYRGLTTAYIPSPTNLVGLAVTWVVAIILLPAGAAVGGPPPPPPGRNAAGWGALFLLVSARGVVGPV